MKKILITGITGFAGQYLAESLIDSSSSELHGTYHSEDSLNRLGEIKNKITSYQVDLTDRDQVEKLINQVQPDEVYNLASQTSPSQSIKDPAETLMTNSLSELYLFEAIKRSANPHSRILAVSSAEIYGAIEPSDLPINEETSLRPTTPYAVSKITQDYLALQYFLAHKLQIVRVRPFNHFGPRQQPKFVLPMFAKQIAAIEKGQQEPVMKVGNLKARKDFTDVRDMVKAYILVMENGIPGEVYAIGSGKSVEIQWLLDTLLSLSDKEISIEEDPALVRPIDTPDIYADHSKVTKLTGWEPQIPLEKTLKDTLDYFRKLV
jgi:GDP-4-dehydro-6-deoxy-D-mannose reductase